MKGDEDPTLAPTRLAGARDSSAGELALALPYRSGTSPKASLKRTLHPAGFGLPKAYANLVGLRRPEGRGPIYRLPPLPPTSTATDDWMFGCSEAWEAGLVCSMSILRSGLLDVRFACVMSPGLRHA